MLHGDFNASNLRVAGGVVRIFDLDDCGYGPPAFDVANALYMVLFDAITHGTADTYESFRRSFVAGYVNASGAALPEESLDRLIDLRVQALGCWLDDLGNAPIGIRTASRAWACNTSIVCGGLPTSDPLIDSVRERRQAGTSSGVRARVQIGYTEPQPAGT